MSLNVLARRPQVADLKRDKDSKWDDWKESHSQPQRDIYTYIYTLCIYIPLGCVKWDDWKVTHSHTAPIYLCLPVPSEY